MRRHGVVKELLFLILLAVFIIANTFVKADFLKITQQDLIYFVLTDRFCNGDSSNDQNVRKNDPSGYHGGDWQGIIDKLDYIKGLGFTAIWISPVVANQVRGYHGYWATDFYNPNQHFGNIEKLKELVIKAHDKKIKVIVDLVVNHVSPMHPWVADPKYINWFHKRAPITNWNDQQEIEQGELANLPDLDQSNPEVKKYLIDMAKWWIREAGIDGYRLDTVRHVSKDFWREFVTQIKKEYPDFFFIGEVFDGHTNYVADYQKVGLDGLLDYPLYFALNDVFKYDQPVSRLTNTIEECHSLYPNVNLMGTFIDNHDVPRFIDQIYDLPLERQRQALAFIMTYTGIPVLYYGSENGMEGGTDPGNRRDMDWSFRSETKEYLETLTAIRKSNKALTYGDFNLINVGPNRLCYLRSFGENTIITLFNLTDQMKQIELSLPNKIQSGKGVLKDLIRVKNYYLTNGKAKIKMSPRQVSIFSYHKI